MKKIIHPCDVPMYNGRKYPMFCEIEIKDGRLSISGVIGPTRSGNAMGGAGQIDMEFDHQDKSENDPRYTDPIKARDLRLAPGWTTAKWYQFLHVWKKWHLNDMHAVCEHQDALGWEYDDHKGDWRLARKQDAEIIERLQTSPSGYILEDDGDRYTLGTDGNLYEWEKFIGHACPECGYRIGSAWTMRELPADVIEFLNSLPDTDRTPNWV